MTDRKNMSIMELAYQILSEHERAMTFIEIIDMICTEKGISEEERLNMMSQVYTDFISSAKFIYVGDDEWDIKGRRTIDLWDKDGAYYDEYPDYEEELNLFEDEKDLDEYSIDNDVEIEEDEDEEESIYEKDITEDDIEDDDDDDYDDFEDDSEDYIEDEEDLDLEDEDEDLEDEEDKEKSDLLFDEDEEEEFDDEEYNEYMDDYEEMYED